MYEHLTAIQEAKNYLFADLEPASPETIREIRKSFPNCPDSYLRFLEEWGSGPIRPRDEPKNYPPGLKILGCPESTFVLFGDKDILQQGAKGDVLIFAFESDGGCIGFDTGADYQLAAVTGNRDVMHWKIAFDKFIEGYVRFYPNVTSDYRDGIWFDPTGEPLSD